MNIIKIAGDPSLTFLSGGISCTFDLLQGKFIKQINESSNELEVCENME